jgi:hypothetical protein
MRIRLMILGVAGAGVLGFGLAQSDTFGSSTTRTDTTANAVASEPRVDSAPPVAIPDSVSQAICEEKTQAVSVYGKVTNVRWAGQITGEQDQQWLKATTGLAPEMSRLKDAEGRAAPDAKATLCIYSGSFNSAAPSMPPAGIDSGPVTEIGVLVTADGTIQISYMHRSGSAQVKTPSEVSAPK